MCEATAMGLNSKEKVEQFNSAKKETAPLHITTSRVEIKTEAYRTGSK